ELPARGVDRRGQAVRGRRRGHGRGPSRIHPAHADAAGGGPARGDARRDARGAHAGTSGQHRAAPPRTAARLVRPGAAQRAEPAVTGGLLAHVDLRALHAELRDRHGPQGWWWPGQEPFEIALGAVLVQRCRWAQAAAALEALRGAGLLAPPPLAAAEEETVRTLVRPAGFPRSKPRRVQALARWWGHGAAAAEVMSDEALRTALLAVEGVGEETADAIGLYCFGRPAFLCDEYARRLLRGRGAAVPASYRSFRRALGPALARARFSVEELAELHGLIVEEGKHAAARGRIAPV